MLHMSMPELQKHVQRRLSAEYLSAIEQKMTITSTTNINRDSVTYTGDVVILSLDEYAKLRYNSVRAEPVAKQPEFDAVDYLKNLMKKTR